MKIYTTKPKSSMMSIATSYFLNMEFCCNNAAYTIINNDRVQVSNGGPFIKDSSEWKFCPFCGSKIEIIYKEGE